MTTTMNLEEAAFDIAYEAHKGQTRRDGLTPYIHHPRAVVNRLKEAGFTDDVTLAVAWLHDVIEDTDVSAGDLFTHGMTPEVVAAVSVLTKRPGEPYSKYLRRLARNKVARRVKVADMMANLADKPTGKQIARYAYGLNFLVNFHHD